jgi:hypothetical protein
MNNPSSIARWIRGLPTVANLVACSTFQTAAAVPLADWSQLDEATVWCVSEWQRRRQHYRRKVCAAETGAIFEFADETHAVTFKLKFG